MKLFYLHNKNNFPVACVASDLKPDGSILVAVSTYNPIDPFDKRVARDVAIGRLASGRHFFCINASNNVKARILELIAGSEYIPNRTKVAARLWLKQATEKAKAA